MRSIFKNFLDYKKMILAIVILLIIQAYCDLSLPQYTSDIIDVGIQNKGTEHILPEKIKGDTFQGVQLFMTEQEKELWQDSYGKSGSDYTRKDISEKRLDSLDDKLIVPMLMAYQMETMATDKGSKEMPSGSQGQNPAEQLKKYRDEVKKNIKTMGSDMVKAMGISYAVKCQKEAGVDNDRKQKDYLWSEGRKMFLVAVIMLIASIMVSYFAAKIGAGIGHDLRKKVFTNVMKFSNGEMDRFSVASLITRSTNDVQQIQMVSTMLLRMIMYAPILGIGGIYKVWQTKANMGWIIFLALLVILGFVAVLMAIALPKFKIMQKLVDGLNLVSREILTGLPVIRAFGREKLEEERFDKANSVLKKTQLFTNRVMTFMMPGMMLIMYSLTIIITWVSAHRIDQGILQVGAMTAFITYSMLIVMSFLMLTMMSIMIPRAGVAAERIQEVINTSTSIVEAESPVEISKQTARGVVEFSHVYFKYPGADEDVLRDISFKAEPGKVTAIIGSTGAGKSTLINLIPRFYDVESGKITFDGTDVRALSLKSLRDEIGLVPQKGILFSGTIEENLRFGNADGDIGEIEEAAAIAQASEFIEEKSEKMNAAIAQGGSNVSGGQKQRLAIARAIAKHPRVFIFDDSFSALDMKTDAKLRKALESQVSGVTEILVAQRISTVLHADQIIVLDEGVIVGIGTHEELMNSCDIYRQIAMSQLSEREIAAMPGREDK